MPGPKSAPLSGDLYRDDVAELRAKAKPNRKARARLKARQEQFDDVDSKRTEHGQAMHRPGSQNRSK